jgi:hypothetical protein
MIDRDIGPVFTQARTAIESVLARYGFRITQETLAYAAFGSAEAEYRQRVHWLRLVWDGKESRLWLRGAIAPDQHVHPGDAAWRDLDPRPAGFALEPGPSTDARITELLTQIELFRASKAAV